MPQETPATDRLDSWKEIATYVGRDVRTVIRWEQKGGLPVYRVPVGQRQAVYAFRHEIDEWMAGATPGSRDLGAALEVAAARPDWNNEAAVAVATPAAPAVDRVRTRPRTWIRVAVGLAVVGLAILIFQAARWLLSPQQIEFTSVAQITSDGTTKEAVVTDGRSLFFNEGRHGRLVLASVAVDGGEIRLIPSPFEKAIPQAISPDGKSLLVLAFIGQETEKTLWILPVSGGEPTRVGHILSHEAAWSPDGRKIAYAYGNALYLTDNQGASAKELQTFTNTPELLEWFPDGTGLRFQLRDLGTRHGSFWEMSFSNADTLSALVPLHLDFDACCNVSSSIDQEARSFLAGDELDPSSIRTIQRVHRLWGSHFSSIRLKPVISNPGYLALDSKSRRLFVTGASASLSARPLQNRSNEAYLYDRKSGEVRPFLPGVSAQDIDFSRDGKWITYVNANTQTLWVSRPNGSDARQIGISAGGIQLPRWSPDDRQIAFMTRPPGKPWRIFVTAVDKDAPREASVGTDNQGAPTWSPDGKWLVYGNVWCEQSKICAIRKINLSNGQVSTLPGSEGFETARWSPDGRYVAALWPDHHSIEVFEVKTEQWRKLADGVTGNDLNWSADSRSLYASNPNGDRPNVIQVSLADGSVKPAVDLSAFKSMTGRIDTWFGVTPDESIIFIRWQAPNEIYALNFIER